MKKILAITVYSITMVILYISFHIFCEVYFQSTFLENSIEINVSNTLPNVEDDEIISKINELANKDNITISRHIYVNADNLSIYTSDVTFSNRINLDLDDNKNKFTNFYLTNEERKEFLKFDYPTDDKQIKLFPIDEIKKYGFVGNYIINLNNNNAENIVDEFSKIFGADSISVYNFHNSSIDFFELYDNNSAIALPLLLLILIFIFIVLLTLIKFVLDKSKDIAILLINGFSYLRTTKILVMNLVKSILISFIFVIATTIAYMYMFSEIVFFFNFFLMAVILYIIYFIIILFVVYICTVIISLNYSKSELLKKRKIFKFFSHIQIVFKFILVTVTMLVLLNGIEINDILTELQDKNEQWYQAENIYKIQKKFVVSSSDLKAVRPYEIKAKSFYTELVKKDNVFLLDTSAYYSSDNGYIWEEESDVYPYYAKSITVNTNYLKRYPIYSFDKNNVLDKIIENEYTLNILVPEKLKIYENDIRKEFLDIFEFYTIEVQRHYYEELGEKMLDITKEELKVNIIYIGEQEYFSYNIDTAGLNNNLITDNPIVIVDTINLDPSCYYSWLSKFVYFESEDLEPISVILPLSQKYELLDCYRTIVSVFDERANLIKKIELQLVFNLVILWITICLLAILIFIINSTYFKLNIKKIFIKHTLGYGILKILRYKLAFDILVYIFILSVFSVPVIYKILLVTFDVIVNMLCIKANYKKSINSVIKGGI